MLANSKNWKEPDFLTTTHTQQGHTAELPT
jgi:hypothetical protein